MGNYVGLDIGYSNVKLTYGNEEGIQGGAVFPVGVALTKEFDYQVQGLSGASVQTTKVLVDGEMYSAGFEPGRVIGSSRDVSENYTSSVQYKALFYAALLHSGMNQIDKLVTGLPVSHYRDENLREQLATMMQGEHQVASRRTITVSEVEIIPQPGGALISVIEELEEGGDETAAEILSEGNTLVIDPGFFSVDFVMFQEGALNYGVSGSSLMATSKVIERAAQKISEDYGHSPGKELKNETLENAIRNGKKHIFYNSNKVIIKEYLDFASVLVGDAAMSEVTGSMRNSALDAVILAGGGAGLYLESAKKAFPRPYKLVSKNPVKAISEGYYSWAARSAE